MEHGFASTLIKCGVLEPKRTGPAFARDPEEAQRIKKEQVAASYARRKALIREAKDRGDPPPVFKLGRPRKYSREEATSVKAQQDREAWRVYKKRVRDGIFKLAELYQQQVGSTGQ